jgi:drug/metabolite transporter (DMT)-like permease
VTRAADRPFLGVLLMLGFCALAPVADAMAKLLGARMGLGQLITVRFAIQAAVLVPLSLAIGAELRLTPRVLWLTALRTVLHVAGVGVFFLALRYLPLADAVAIAFVMPFVMLLLGRFVLGETVGRRRMAACAVGFAGTLLVIQPSFASVGAAALLPLGAAVIFAFFMLVTRQIARDADPVALQAMSGVMATAGLVPLMALGGALGWPEFGLTPLAAGDAWLLAAMGVFATLVHLLMTWSLRFAPAATVAPMQYIEIPFATATGYVVFGALPNGLAAVGIVITVAAGLYIIHRERAAQIAADRAGRPLPSGAEV